MDNKKLISNINEYLLSKLSTKRYEHTIGVATTACLIGKHHNLDHDTLYISALLHDISKHLSLDSLLNHCIEEGVRVSDIEKSSHGLLHSFVSAILADKLFSIKDKDIIDPIKSHTLGRVNMSSYEEIIFISDHCEPSRKIANRDDIIKKASSNLRAALFEVLVSKLQYVMSKGAIMHPKSVAVYNYYRKYK